jgi:hypothetical protein
VLADLGPQVEEWRNLVAFLPFDARVSMSSAAPAPNVQIRSDQWHLLGMVGSPGRTVRAVLDVSDAHPLETLRTLRELIDAQLVSLVLATAASPAHAPGIGLYDIGTSASAFEPSAYEPAPRDAPPPPWATSSTAPSTAPERDGWTAEDEREPSTGPVAASPAPPGPPAPPEGWVEREEAIANDPDHANLAVATPGGSVVESPNGSAMPPPITGDPWSASAGSTAIPLTEQGPSGDPGRR